MTTDLFINLILAFIFGATVGLERESSKGSGPHVGGIRTFALISLMGAVAGIFIVHQYVVVGMAVVAGFLGGYFGSRRFPVRTIRLTLAAVLLIAGGKLVFGL